MNIFAWTVWDHLGPFGSEAMHIITEDPIAYAATPLVEQAKSSVKCDAAGIDSALPCMILTWI